MAQLSWAKTLAQVSPADGAARVPRTAVLSRPRLLPDPSLVQWRPPSVLVRDLMPGSGWFPCGDAGYDRAAPSCPVGAPVAKTLPGPLITDVQCAPPSRLTSTRPGQPVSAR